MSGELDLYGVFVPSLLAWGAIAVALTMLLRTMLRQAGLYRFIWHAALFDLAVFVIMLGAVISTTSIWTMQ